MKMQYLLPLLLALLSVSCRHNDNNKVVDTQNTGVDIPGPTIQLSAFPLKAGNMWVYDNGDTITVGGDTVINGITATRLLKKNAHFSLTAYCASLTDGLHMIAANYNNFQSLVVPAIYDILQLQVADPSVQFTMLPVSLNNSWDAHIPHMNHSQRQWVKYVTVPTPAGTFNCVKLTAGYLDEYYSDKGIVQIVDHPECFVAPCGVIVTKLVYVNF